MPLSPGDHLEEFVLCRRIGEGAFGEVWEAEDAGARVALKVPTHPEAVQELRREGRIQERLSHPSIVPTLALRLDHDPPYVVFQLVEGPSLADLLREKRTLPWQEAVRVLRGLLEALVYAHAGGVIHRDVKPENVLLAPDGDVLLTDFGLGRATEAAARSLSLSVSRSDGEELRLVGTLRYMSPEQAEGRGATERSDLYAAGVVLHEMLTGDATRMRFPIAEAPVWLSAVAERATRPDPLLRYRSAEEMLRALDAPVLRARARGMFSRLQVADQERRLGRIVLGLMAVALLASGAFWLWVRDEEWESRQTRATGVPAAREGLPAATIVASDRALHALAASPDGCVVAAGGEGDTVTLWSVASTARILGSEMPCATHSLAFSRDGQRLVAGGADGRIRILEVSTGRELEEFSGHESTVGSVAVSEDDSLVASGGWDWTVRVWDAKRGGQEKILADGRRVGAERPAGWSHPEQGCEVAILGSSLVATDAAGRLREWDLGDLRRVFTPLADAEGIRSAALAPDGTRWASVGRRGTIALREQGTGGAIRTLWTGTTHAREVAFSADGRFVAACGWGASAWLRDLGPANRGERLQMRGRDANAILFLPGQLWSANDDGTIAIWRLPSEK